jgi:hypothetical protein
MVDKKPQITKLVTFFDENRVPYKMVMQKNGIYLLGKGAFGEVYFAF